MSKLSKAKGCVGGLLLGSAVRALVFILTALIKVLASVMVFFGLWAPFFFALLGGVLYLVFKFDPFSGSIDSKLYLAGFAGTVLCALLITIRHLFEKPAQSVAEGFKKPIWRKPSAQDDDYTEDSETSHRDYVRPKRRYPEEDYSPSRDDDYRRERREEYSRSPRREDYDRRRPMMDYPQDNVLLTEKPKIYYSSLEKYTLVHEYGDRFEVYRVIDGRPVLDKVEYKSL